MTSTLQGDVHWISHQLLTTQLNLTPVSLAFNTQVRRVSFTFSPLLCPLTYTSQFKAPQKLLTWLFVPALQNFLSPSKHQRQPGNMLDNLPQGRCFFFFFFLGHYKTNCLQRIFNCPITCIQSRCRMTQQSLVRRTK